MKRPSASARAGDDAEPALQVRVQRRPAAAARATSVCRLSAIDLIGASELLISWLSTRTSRCHAWRSSSRSVRAQVGEHQQLVRQPALAELAAPHLPAAAAAGQRQLEQRAASRPRAPRPARARRRRGRAARSAGRPSSRSPARFTSRSRRSASNANTATSISSITRRSSAVASSAPSRCSRSVSPSALTSQNASPSGSSLRRAPRADREVALAQRGQHVGERLQRPHHALAHRQRRSPTQRHGDQRRTASSASWARAAPVHSSTIASDQRPAARRASASSRTRRVVRQSGAALRRARHSPYWLRRR